MRLHPAAGRRPQVEGLTDASTVDGSPVLVDGDLFIRTKRHLACLRER